MKTTFLAPIRQSAADVLRRLSRFVILPAVSVAWLWPSAAIAVSPDYQCTAPGVTPGSRCSSVQPTPWTFIASMGYNETLDPKQYRSFNEIAAAIETKRLASDWCSMDLDHVDEDYAPGPWMHSSGVGYYSTSDLDVRHQHRLNFNNIVVFDSTGCQTTWTWVYQPWVLQDRTATCPKGERLIYEAGPPEVGPYCALPWSEIDQVKSAGRCVSGQLTKGNPCELGSGNKHQVERDYLGAGSFPLKFERHFNSLIAYSYPYSISQWRYEPVGIGWSANYFQRIDYQNSGAYSTAFLHRPDGRRLAFNESGTDFTAPADVNMQLTASRDATGVITGWTLMTDEHETETYDANGKLLSIANRAGLVHTLTYGAGGDPQSVADHFGNQLQFSYDSVHRLVQITDQAGETIQYSYGSKDNLRIPAQAGH